MTSPDHLVACAVLHVFSCVEECLEERFSKLCNLLFLRLLLFFTLLLSSMAE